jgi:predicted nucleic acid-binding protein
VRVVVDASVVLQLLVAGARLGPLTGHELRAPALLPSEVTSALRELVWRGDVPESTINEVLIGLASLEITHERPGSLAVEATEVAARLGWAKTYDAEYVALARKLDCPLITLDGRLRRGIADYVGVMSPTEL